MQRRGWLESHNPVSRFASLVEAEMNTVGVTREWSAKDGKFGLLGAWRGGRNLSEQDSQRQDSCRQ
jgi:hypothetical protein